MAAVGQAATHGASSHWLQRVTWKERRACGNVPTSTAFTYVRVTPSGTWFSDLHAVVQAWQPMQRVWSSTFTYRARPLLLVEEIADVETVFGDAHGPTLDASLAGPAAAGIRESADSHTVSQSCSIRGSAIR